jgi:hypothetical protein
MQAVEGLATVVPAVGVPEQAAPGTQLKAMFGRLV